VTASLLAPHPFHLLGLPMVLRTDGGGSLTCGQHRFSVQPGLTALNTFLAEENQRPIPLHDIAKAGLRGIDWTTSRNSLLARDLATRGRPVFHFDLSQAEAADRPALQHLFGAASLMDVFHRLQVEPNFVEQFRAIVDEGNPLAIAHYWMRGYLGALEPTQHDSSQVAAAVLPGANRTPNGVWWPDHFTQADINALRKNLSADLKAKVFAPMSMLVAAREGDTDAFLHQDVWYKPAHLGSHPDLELLGKMMADRINLAAAELFSTHTDFAHMLAGRAEAVRGAHFFADRHADVAWVTQHHPRISFAAGPGENAPKYGDPFGVKYSHFALVGYSPSKAQAAIAQKMLQLREAANERLVALWTANGEVAPFPTGVRPGPEIDIVNAVFPFGHANSASYVASGFTRPNADLYEGNLTNGDVQNRLVLLAQIMRSRVENQALPMAKALFGEVFAAKLERMLTDNAYTIFTLAHELAHNDGVDQNAKISIPSFDDPISIADAVNNIRLVMGFEEGKADIMGASRLWWYHEQGAFDEADLRGAQALYLLSLLRNLYMDPPEIHATGARYQWKLLVDAGVVDFSNTDNPFDFEKLEHVLPALVKAYTELYGSGDNGRLMAHHEAALALCSSGEVGEAKAKLEADAYPKMDNPLLVLDGIEGF